MITMTTSWTWRNAALASLLTSSLSVAGQQIILIPLSSSPPAFTTHPGNSYEAEPPCRQQRLEPWRQQVREQCRAEAESRCSDEPRAPLRGGRPDSYVSFGSPSSPASALFGQLFAAGPQEAGVNDEDEEFLDELFNRMLGFSLRAFDKMVEEHPDSPEEEEEDEGAEEDSLEPASPEEEEAEIEDEEEYPDYSVGYSEEEEVENVEEISRDDYLMRKYVASAPTPEQAAENALDVMVASLMAARSSADVKEAEHEVMAAEPEEEERTRSVFPSAAHLPLLLARRGDTLLADAAANAARRRLTEGAVAEDPRARVATRLARRLTEYRTDLFLSPADGSISLYTTTFRPVFAHEAEATPPALGLGSRPLDACVRTAFRRRELATECHRAVGELLLATDHGSPASPYHGDFGEFGEGESAIPTLIFGTAMIFAFGGLFCVLMNTVEKYFGIDDEDDEEDEGDEEVEEEGSEFDYTTLPDGWVSRAGRPLGEPRVFVGVPVQVV